MEQRRQSIRRRIVERIARVQESVRMRLHCQSDKRGEGRSSGAEMARNS